MIDNGFWHRLKLYLQEAREEAIEGMLKGLEQKNYLILVGQVRAIDETLAKAREIIGEIDREDGL